MKKAIVTGASGFIGKKLLLELLKNDIKVYAVFRNESKLIDIDNKNLIKIKCELNDYINLDQYIKDPNIDYFFHLAWDGVFGEIFKNYEHQLKNCIYSCDALNAAIKIGCKKFILTGSLTELEIINYVNKDIIKPRYTCIYGTAKLAAKLICKTIAYNNNIEFNSAILASVYGEGDRSRLITNVLLKNLVNGKSPKLINGEELYDWIYIDDVVKGLFLIGEKGINLKSYYVGNRKIKKFKDTVLEIKNIINPNIELKFGEIKDKMDIDFSLIDLDGLYNDTGFEAKSDFRESILKTAEWVKNLDIQI